MELNLTTKAGVFIFYGIYQNHQLNTRARLCTFKCDFLLFKYVAERTKKKYESIFLRDLLYYYIYISNKYIYVCVCVNKIYSYICARVNPL